MSKFTEEYNKIITSHLVKYIQEQLLTYFHKQNWTEYVDSLKFGDCQTIAKIVYNMCPSKIEIYEVEEHFCQNAVEELQSKGDYDLTYGNHYIVKIGDLFYDFGKGANSINGIYTVGTNQQKYTVQLSSEELQCFTKFYLKDCNYWDHIKINKKRIVPFKID